MKVLLNSIVMLVESSRGKTLLAVGVLVFCVHLGWSVWFVTASPTNMPKTPLWAQGDEFLRSYPSWDTDYESDGAFHNRAALGVLETGLPRTRSGSFCDHSPVYAYFSAGCYKLGGLRLLSIAIPQAIISGALAVVLGLAASRLASMDVEWTAAALTALLLLFHLDFATFVAYPNPSTLLMLVFASALLAASRPVAGNVVLFTLAMAVGIFTHTAFFIVAGAAGLWLLIQFAQRKERTYLGCALLLLAVAALKLGVSMIDNSSNSMDHIRKASQGLAWYGNNPYYEDLGWSSLWEQRVGNPSGWQKWKKTVSQEQRFQDYLARSGGNERDAGMLWIRENPRQYAKLCFIRLRTELGAYTGNASLPRKVLGTILWTLVFPAGAYGLWRARASAFSLLASLIIVAVVVFDSLIFVNFRYRLPVEMILTVFAGLTYAYCLRAWTGIGAGEIRRPAEVIPAPCKPVCG